MKFPKLLYVIGIVFIYTNSLPSLLAQVNPSLNSSKGNGPTIELCRGESISFSISGGVQFSFSRIRGGITTVVRAKSASNLFSSNDFEINLNPYGQNIFPTNTFLYVYQHFKKFGNTTQLSFNQNLQFNQFTVGFAQNAGKVTTFGLQSFGLTMGLILENFSFGFQYNFPIKSVGNTQSPNILELHLGFDFSPYRRNNRGYHKRIRIDNY